MAEYIGNFLLSAKLCTISEYTIVYQLVTKLSAEFPTFEFAQLEVKRLNYGYEAVKSLNEIGAFSYNESSQDENGSNNIPISRNIEELQKKLTSPESDIDTELCDAVLEKLSNIDIKNLS
ncbi:hypothetical protein RclHR1_10990005 [Rhizophagus clarus]|uniref:Uncharacterized protein n=1 Tax=Rhizophagus clarus TaxID=94130 RepID=A0A2Z6QHT7_9GLOM|nr:hypothetical protein RclHR1_10990005 [Rhizophagus clarus]